MGPGKVHRLQPPAVLQLLTVGMTKDSGLEESGGCAGCVLFV